MIRELALTCFGWYMVVCCLDVCCVIRVLVVLACDLVWLVYLQFSCLFKSVLLTVLLVSLLEFVCMVN